jgi:tetratricopeptide (TPR) repeat protein
MMIIGVVGLGALTAAAFVAPLTGLRICQKTQLRHLAEQLTKATLEPVPIKVAFSEGHVLLRSREPLPGLVNAEELPPGETAWEYAALVFDTHGHDIPLKVQYDENRLLNDFSQETIIHGVKDDRTGRITFFFPVYEVDTAYSMDMLEEFVRTFPNIVSGIDDPRPIPEQDWWRRSKFLGVSFPEKYLGLFEGFYVVRNIEDIPLLPIFQIPEDRRFLRLYKTGPWERRLRDAIAMRWAGADEEVSPTINNDFWQLDERLLYHPPSEIFTSLLLPQTPGDDYVTEWRARAAYLPELSKTAAFDLANAGTIWWNDGLSEDAISAYRAACEFDPDGPLYRVRLGQLLEHSGDVEEAMKQYMRALRLQSLLPDTAEKVDGFFTAKEIPAEQRLFWKQVFDLHPDCWFSGMRAGNLFEADEMFEAAAELYGRVHHAHPEHPDTRLALARCLGRTGRYVEAVELIMATATAHPEYEPLVTSHLETLGDFLFGEGAYIAAEEVFTRLVEVAPDNPSHWLRLGDVRAQNGRIDTGRYAYAHALQLAGDSDTALQETIRRRMEAISTTDSNDARNRVE